MLKPSEETVGLESIVKQLLTVDFIQEWILGEAPCPHGRAVSLSNQ